MVAMAAREKRLWIQAALVQLLIYASLAYVRAPSDWLRERNLLRLTVGLLFAIAVALVVRQVARSRPGPRELLALAAFGLISLVFLLRIRQVEERVHLLEYGLVTGLIYAALLERRARLIAADARPLALTRFPALAAIAIGGLLGWGDELIQWVLPERYYALSDVALNVAAGTLVVLAMAARRWARRLDQAPTAPDTPR